MSASPAIVARDLVKRYRVRKGPDVRALDGFSLKVTPGAWLALLGPNGSGKSTFLKCLTRTLAPDEGSLEILGIASGAQTASLRRRLGVVFQSPGLDRLLTVRENLMTQCALFGWTGAGARERIERHAESVGLTDRLHTRVGALSGGLARRADLARALVSEPEVLLLDEPTTGLDPEARVGFLDLISRTRSERPEMTVVMSTHLMDEADRCDRVALVGAGRVLAHETPNALRGALGELALHAPARSADVLRSMGLDVRTDENRVIAAGTLESLSRAAERLTLDGATFSIEPPSLEDVYLAYTSERAS